MTIAGASVKELKERFADGKSRRNAVSRPAHANLNPKERGFDPIALLRELDKGRIPHLLPIKYARMKVSPFAFFRGAVSIMAADLARLPNSGLQVQLCGDAHVQNLGSFAAPDGKLVFDLNDFDETVQGPWEWDVKRMAASLVLAGRESDHGPAACREAAELCARSYCAFIRELAREPLLDAARSQVRREGRIKPIHAALRQSERARPLDLLAKLTESDRHGRSRFRHQPPILRRIRGRTAQEILDSIDAYRETLAPERRHLFDMFRAVDVGFKVVGTGSVGLRDYVVLFEGNGPRDPMFLQIKQEVASVYAKFLPLAAAKHQGLRVVEGQRAIQPQSDPLLGWTGIGPREYLVRQFRDHKGGIDLRRLRGRGLNSLAMVAGELLARGHTRSGDACRISGYCGSGAKMSKVLGNFAIEYADQTEADYRAFIAGLKRRAT
jgi:uncharacterized protein (DUF2252 family)